MAELTVDERKSLKLRGYLSNKDGEHFSGRIITEDGTLTSDDLMVISEAAKRFGNGEIGFTTRMTVEVQGLTLDTIDPFETYIRGCGLDIGGTGPKVRPIISCKGTVCSHGLYDTQALARRMHQRFFIGWRDETLPVKFKIGVGGCPNNCIKPHFNDVGVIGQKIPAYDETECKRCKSCACVPVCPVKNIITDDDRRMHLSPDGCVGCGKCIGKCRFGLVTEGKTGFKLVLGGMGGKRQHIADPMGGIWNEDQVIEIVERCLRIYHEEGEPGERFGKTIQRLGWDRFIELLDVDSL